MSCLFQIVILCFTFVVVSYCQGWIFKDDDSKFCQTSHGQTGKCIPATDCIPIKEAINKAEKPLTLTVRDQLNLYICSFDNGVVNVCCPNGTIYFENNTNDSIVNNTNNVKNVTEGMKNITDNVVRFKSPDDEGGGVNDPDFLPDVTNHKNLHLLPTDCGKISKNIDKIINGKNAFLNEFPWMALISYTSKHGPTFKCGGTIVNERYILTAAHCVVTPEDPLRNVRIGEYHTGNETDCQPKQDGTVRCALPTQDVGIEEVIYHPKFNWTTLKNDIALLRVAPMNITVENAQPICLPIGKLKNEELKTVRVTGWGIVDILSAQKSEILQKVSLDVVDLKSCQRAYRRSKRITIDNRQLCASKKKKDTCSGDSGGPLQVASYFNRAARYVQYGIISFGAENCAEVGLPPGVYTKVASYMDWILDSIKN